MKFTYYTIAGKNPKLIRDHLKHVKVVAGFDALPCEKELIVVVYCPQKIDFETHQAVLAAVEEAGASVHIFMEPDSVFLTNLYACWNLGYELADDGWVFRAGSDQVFNTDAFVHLYQVAEAQRQVEPWTIFQAQTFENAGYMRQSGMTSRHMVYEGGDGFDEFSQVAFDDHLRSVNAGVEKSLLNIAECLEAWGHPTQFQSSLGLIDRTDGCSWLMTKQDWLDHGPLPPMEGGVTGDVMIHDRLQRAGYDNLLVRDCATYHFVRGESRSQY